MSSVVTTATDRCDEDVDSLARQLSVPALEHLRLGAERYEAFRRAYPFRIRQERRTITLDSVGKPRRVRQADERARSEDWGESYRARGPRRRVGRLGFHRFGDEPVAPRRVCVGGTSTGRYADAPRGLHDVHVALARHRDSGMNRRRVVASPATTR
jgi:hypothetical protein